MWILKSKVFSVNGAVRHKTQCKMITQGKPIRFGHTEDKQGVARGGEMQSDILAKMLTTGK